MLASVDQGSGRPLVFLHGITCDKTHWGLVTDALRAEFRCVRIDLPGHGDSPDPPLDVFGQVEAIHEVVEDLGLEPPVMVGHSAGGLTSLVYAILKPTSGVVVVDQPLDMSEFGRWVTARRDEWRDPDGWEAAFEGFVAEYFEPELIPADRRWLIADHVRPTQEILLTMWAPLLDDAGTAAAQLEAALPAVSAPVVLLYAHPPTAEEERLIGLLPDATVETWDGLGHFIPLADPDRTASRVREFALSL